MVTVNIVTFRNPDAVTRCVQSLAAQDCRPFLVNVLDDSDTDWGYSVTANIGLRRAIEHRDKYAFLLNQDLVLYPDCIGNALRFMFYHPKAGCAAFKTVARENPDLIIHGGTQQSYPTGIHHTGRVSLGDCAVSRQFNWVNGAGIIYRVAALADVGLLDERFILYMQDTDWCTRSRANGWEVWYCAEAVAMDEQDGCSANPSERQKAILRHDIDAFRDKWVREEPELFEAPERIMSQTAAGASE